MDVKLGQLWFRQRFNFYCLIISEPFHLHGGTENYFNILYPWGKRVRSEFWLKTDCKLVE